MSAADHVLTVYENRRAYEREARQEKKQIVTHEIVPREPIHGHLFHEMWTEVELRRSIDELRQQPTKFDQLRELWPEGCPTPHANERWTTTQISKISLVIEIIKHGPRARP